MVSNFALDLTVAVCVTFGRGSFTEETAGDTDGVFRDLELILLSLIVRN